MTFTRITCYFSSQQFPICFSRTAMWENNHRLQLCLFCIESKSYVKAEYIPDPRAESETWVFIIYVLMFVRKNKPKKREIPSLLFHIPASVEKWMRTEPSQSDLLYLHPRGFLLNISVCVFAPEIECEIVEGRNRFVAGKDRGRQSDVMTSTVTVCSLSWCAADPLAAGVWGTLAIHGL